MDVVTLTWLASAAGEEEEGGEVLELFEMWKYSTHLAEEKSNLKCIRNLSPSQLMASHCRLYSEAGDLITRKSAMWLQLNVGVSPV